MLKQKPSRRPNIASAESRFCIFDSFLARRSSRSTTTSNRNDLSQQRLNIRRSRLNSYRLGRVVAKPYPHPSHGPTYALSFYIRHWPHTGVLVCRPSHNSSTVPYIWPESQWSARFPSVGKCADWKVLYLSRSVSDILACAPHKRWSCAGQARHWNTPNSVPYISPSDDHVLSNPWSPPQPIQNDLEQWVQVDRISVDCSGTRSNIPAAQRSQQHSVRTWKSCIRKPE
jgi:hypothetical protein